MERDYDYMVATECFTFNQAAYIETALQGFAMQKVSFPVVFIIVDDASTDGEQDVLKCWAKKNLEYSNDYPLWENRLYGEQAFAKLGTDENIYFLIILLEKNHFSQGLHQIKRGYYKDWIGRAKYISWCEGDDYWIDSFKLSKQIRYLEEHKDCGLVHGLAKAFDEVSGSFNSQLRGGNYKSFNELLKANKIITLTVCVRSVAYYEYLREYSKWNKNDELKMIDYSVWLWISKFYKTYFFDEIFGVYRVLPESTSHTKNIKKMVNFLNSIYEIQKCYSERFDESISVRREIYNNYVKSLVSLKKFNN